MITFLGLICDSRHPSIRSKSVDLTSNLSSKIPSREEANTANLDIHVISRAGSIPKFFGSGSEFQATFGSDSNRFYLELIFRFRFWTLRFLGSEGSNSLAKKCPNFCKVKYLYLILKNCPLLVSFIFTWNWLKYAKITCFWQISIILITILHRNLCKIGIFYGKIDHFACKNAISVTRGSKIRFRFFPVP